MYVRLLPLSRATLLAFLTSGLPSANWQARFDAEMREAAATPVRSPKFVSPRWLAGRGKGAWAESFTSMASFMTSGTSRRRPVPPARASRPSGVGPRRPSMARARKMASIGEGGDGR